MNASQRTSLKLDGLITLKTSLVHSEIYLGVDAKFAREKVLINDTDTEWIPRLSGNAIRGRLRDLAATYYLDGLGLPTVPLKLFYLLFSGGSLSRGESKVDLELKRNIGANVPLLSVWGCAIGNQMIHGRLKVGKAYPVARETERLLPERFHSRPKPSVWELITEESMTRLDDVKDEWVSRYCKEMAQQEPLPKESPVQMRYRVETLCPGTQLYHWFSLQWVTPVEIGCFLSALKRFQEHPFMGGMSAIGHGLVEMIYGEQVVVSESRFELSDELHGCLEAYDRFLKENTASVKFLERLHDRL